MCLTVTECFVRVCVGWRPRAGTSPHPQAELFRGLTLRAGPPGVCRGPKSCLPGGGTVGFPLQKAEQIREGHTVCPAVGLGLPLRVGKNRGDGSGRPHVELDLLGVWRSCPKPAMERPRPEGVCLLQVGPRLDTPRRLLPRVCAGHTSQTLRSPLLPSEVPFLTHSQHPHPRPAAVQSSPCPSGPCDPNSLSPPSPECVLPPP